MLRAQGSFFIGGEKSEQTRVELGGLGPGGHITVHQMYVRYMVPQGGDRNVPVVLGRGRSGFNQAVFNNVRAGSTPAGNLPNMLRFSDEVVWPNFRFGSKPGAPYPDSQFPVAGVDELAKQGVPDLSFGGLPTPNPTLKALSERWRLYRFWSSSAITATRRQESRRGLRGKSLSIAVRNSSVASRLPEGRRRCSTRRTAACAATAT